MEYKDMTLAQKREYGFVQMSSSELLTLEFRKKQKQAERARKLMERVQNMKGPLPDANAQ